MPSVCPLSYCRYVKTTGNATVDHLSKYLALRIALERRQQQEAGEPGGPGGGTSDPTAGPDGGGGEGGGAGGADGPEEPALPSLEGVSEKQYTIYIAPGGGAFTVSAPECRGGGGRGAQPQTRPPHRSALFSASLSPFCFHPSPSSGSSLCPVYCFFVFPLPLVLFLSSHFSAPPSTASVDTEWLTDPGAGE